MSLETFVSVLSKYLDMPSVQLIIIAIRSGQERYASGAITDKDVDRGARKLCRMIKGALGTNVINLEQEVGARFDDWCVESVKTIIAGSLSALTPVAAIEFFKPGEETESERGSELKLF
jgi:hypothetical protein